MRNLLFQHFFSKNHANNFVKQSLIFINLVPPIIYHKDIIGMYFTNYLKSFAQKFSNSSEINFPYLPLQDHHFSLIIINPKFFEIF